MNKLLNLTPYPDINEVLAYLLAAQQSLLGDKLVGLYLYGSLVWGEFDHDMSDLDMLAALTDDLSESEATAIKQMHTALELQFPQWRDRIEVQYFAVEGLQNFRTKSYAMGNISPGEPFHLIEAGQEWLLNWYFVQAYGLNLFGPPPQTLYSPIPKEEFIAGVREHVEMWRTYITHTEASPPFQGYAILTLCRAYYTLTHGEQVSKQKAALWAIERFPEHANLIKNALSWRKDPANSQATYAEAKAFVDFMIEACSGL